MRARTLYGLPPGPSAERTRLWRLLLGSEGALVKMIARCERPDEPNLSAAASLLEMYRGARRLERCLERARCTGVRALIVGESPNGRAGPFDGPVGDRLARLLGVESIDSIAECVNLLLDEEVGHVGVRAIRARASALPTRRRIVIACGRTAAAGFGLEDAPFFEWRSVGRAAVVVVPHPSGRNRWWNDEGNRAQAERAIGRIGRALSNALASYAGSDES